MLMLSMHIIMIMGCYVGQFLHLGHCITLILIGLDHICFFKLFYVGLYFLRSRSFDVYKSLVCKTVNIVLQCTLPVDQGLGLLVNLYTKCTAHFQLNPPCSQITTAVCFSLFRYTLERLHAIPHVFKS